MCACDPRSIILIGNKFICLFFLSLSFYSRDELLCSFVSIFQSGFCLLKYQTLSSLWTFTHWSSISSLLLLLSLALIFSLSHFSLCAVYDWFLSLSLSRKIYILDWLFLYSECKCVCISSNLLFLQCFLFLVFLFSPRFILDVHSF